ncbi:hypothetical protein [Frankia sp. AiPa1]|uniref:hypothetical protein n=1 Tax=Frankia sp. AiPa1 TaxID=573492 RepID=UPI00202B8382|nr:hypothetical protein [Frankia sp. AiPa1]MCL9758639.1 hypothetical protein [Frankia sp. AiPa1]
MSLSTVCGQTQCASPPAGVLVARALRDAATVIDLARDGAGPLVRWLEQVNPG